MAMKALMPFTLALMAVITPRTASAQPGADARTEWRLGGARSATPTGPGHLKEVAGVLIVDRAAGQIRLETAGRVVFLVPQDRIAALHYEESDYPRRFLWRSSHYLTVHYTNPAGKPAFETIRFSSERDALTAIAILEQHTGHSVDRSPATESFLGIPNRARAGARVAVIDRKGETFMGTVAELSASALTLDATGGRARVFDATSVRQIRLLYSPKHDALVGFGMGAGLAIFAVYVSAGVAGCFAEGSSGDCPVARTMAGAAAAGGGVGALIGATIGAVRYPVNNAFDVYRAQPSVASGRPAVAIMPQLEKTRRGVTVSVRF